MTDTQESGPVIVAGWMDWRPGDREPVLTEFARLFEPSRAEPGCVAYVATADPVFADRIWVYEQWTSNTALVEHLTLPHVLAFRDSISHFVRTDQSMLKYAIASSGPVR